ncbi:MAG: N-formylglutamate amidohydrolase [Steroidobacteraceae bacterium]
MEGTPEQALLEEGEPAPFRVLNADSRIPALLACDHASRRFPRAVGDMGLDPVAMRCHLAWDIGAGALTEALAGALSVTAVLGTYSRLVVDCNRQLLDPGAFPEFGDGVIIPGNRRLSAQDRERRAAAIYWPYHRAIESEISRLAAAGVPPVVVSVHSFTPVLDGVPRPWQVGVLWDADRPTAELVIRGFVDAGYLVGDNEPYSGKAPQDFTIDHHAEAGGLPHVGIEIRQDLIDDEAGVAEMAAVLCPIIAALPSRIHVTDIRTGRMQRGDVSMEGQSDGGAA